MTAPEYEWRSFIAAGGGELHRSAYRSWGRADGKRCTICVHGLSRNSGDFDALAKRLSRYGHVVCPDIVGRGRSGRLRDGSGYVYPTYSQDMSALIAHLGCDAVDWIGTSMGGMIGLHLAASPGTPIRRLILNDIGPFIPARALSQVRTTLDGTVTFSSVDEAETYLRKRHSGFGNLTDTQWRKLAADSVELDAQLYRFSFDPAIADALPDVKEDVNLWDLWQRVQVPVLVLRGENSGILTAETARRMESSRRNVTVREFVGTGHAPALVDAEQIQVVKDWLLL